MSTRPSRRFTQGKVKMPKPSERLWIFSSGGRSIVDDKLAYEVMAGVVALLMAGVANASGLDVTGWRFAIAGACGFAGAICFTSETMSAKQRLLAVALGGAMASMLGPLAANWAGFALAWVPPGNYYVDATAGFLVGLASTPILRFVRNPIPALTFLVTILPWPWSKKKDNP